MKGVQITFFSLPLAVRFRINKSARLHADFVDQAVLELVNSDRVCRVRKQPFIVNPLSLSYSAVWSLDLRHVNRSLIKQRIKYEDWKIALAYFAKDTYMFSFDLKSGYHHMKILQDHQTFLGFCWRILRFHRSSFWFV